jgi:hypothetical protein
MFKALILKNRKEINKYHEQEDFLKTDPEPKEEFDVLNLYLHKSSITSAIQLNKPNALIQPVFEIGTIDDNVFMICGPSAQKFIDNHFTE